MPDCARRQLRPPWVVSSRKWERVAVYQMGAEVNERILIVDDSRDTADSLAKLITAFGYEAKAVYDGRQAIDEARAFLPDMALIDIGMPGFDGYETVIQLRQQRDGGQVILVAVTGWSREQDKQRAYAAGFDLHVSKPMSVEMLQELLGLLDPATSRR
jgi:CheY-like chemotaxis protein